MNRLANIFLIVLFFSISTYAARKNTQENKSETEPKSLKIDKKYVEKTIKELTGRLKQASKNSKIIYATELSIFASNLETIEKYPDIEIETGTYRKWYKLLTQIVQYLARAKRVEKTAKLANNEKYYSQALAAYKRYIKNYRELLKNKKKYEIPEKKLQELIKKKKEEERKKREARRKSHRR